MALCRGEGLKMPCFSSAVHFHTAANSRISYTCTEHVSYIHCSFSSSLPFTLYSRSGLQAMSHCQQSTAMAMASSLNFFTGSWHREWSSARSTAAGFKERTKRRGHT